MRTSTAPGAALRVLVASCHPLPTLAVTTFAAALGVAIGLDTGTLALVVIAVLCGQLSIGWSNDVIDAGRDAAAGRVDKPLATQPALIRLATTAAAIALVGCMALSLMLGVVPAAFHLVTVGAGWAYNLWLKTSWWSWLPFPLAFGALPVFVYGGLPGQPWAPVSVVVCSALLGTGAHLVNAAPDLDADRDTGVRGAAVQWGARNALAVALTCFGLAGVIAAGTIDGDIAALRWVLAAVGLILLIAAGGIAVTWPPTRRAPRWFFHAALALIALEIALVLLLLA